MFFNIKEVNNAYNRSDHQKVKCCEKLFDKISIFIGIEYLIIINSIRFNAKIFRISSALKSIFLSNWNNLAQRQNEIRIFFLSFEAKESQTIAELDENLTNKQIFH
jgi:hypothetical protein